MKRYFFLLALVFFSACAEKNSNKLASVNGHGISKAELKHWMLLEKANVFNHFYREYGAVDSENFWTTKIGDEIPLELLKKVALEKATRCKVQQLMALEKGIIHTANFEEIQSVVETVNERRKKMVGNGEPIYGPEQFTSRTYFFHVFDKMVIDLKGELSKSDLRPDNEYLEQMKLGIDASEKVNFELLAIQYVERNYDQYVDQLLGKMELQVEDDKFEEINLN